MTKKKDVTKEVKKKDPVITQEQVNAIWDVIDDIQKHLDYIDEKLGRCMSRLGVE